MFVDVQAVSKGNLVNQHHPRVPGFTWFGIFDACATEY